MSGIFPKYCNAARVKLNNKIGGCGRGAAGRNIRGQTCDNFNPATIETAGVARKAAFASG